MRTIFLVALLATGCGAAPSDPASVVDPIVGMWELTLPTGCLKGRAFFEDGTCALDVFCILPSGAFGLQRTYQHYTDANGILTTTAYRSSCAAASKATFSSNYRITGNTLVISNSSSVSSYMHVTPVNGGDNGVITFGCFDSAGVFAAAPVADL